LVGAPLAVDLAREETFQITVADNSEASLNKFKTNRRIHTVHADLSRSETVGAVVRDHDMVVGALPGFMGYSCVRWVIEAGKDMVDISFFPEDPFNLNDLAREHGVTVLCDMGVAPGMSHMLAGHAASELDVVEKVMIYVGGLPKKKEEPWEFKTLFSPADVIEEYTRPARFIENGSVVVKPALSDPEIINFPVAGDLMAFNTDGLRTLVHTIKAPWMREKTLRYINHYKQILELKNLRLFGTNKINVEGLMINPRNVINDLLLPQWEMKPDDEDMTVMKVIIEGTKDDKKLRHVYNLFDEYDRVAKIHSMARTTAYTATMAVRMMSKGLYHRKGISPPEYVGQDKKCFDFMLKGLREKGVIYRHRVSRLK